MKTAYLFAGQGAQYTGMGRDLYEKYEESRRILDAAGEKIRKLCFHGSAEELKETQNTQPCVYAVTMAAYEAFRSAAAGDEKIPQPSALAGFSLGEYAALTAAGMITDISTGVDLMEKRGRWMGQAGRAEDGSQKGCMAAAIGDVKKVNDCIAAARGDEILIAANFNAPTQTVVSGDIAAVERFTEMAKEYRLRVTPLAVSSAFHSPMMEPASEKMRALIRASETKLDTRAALPVYSNLTASPLSEYRAGQASAQAAFGQETLDQTDIDTSASGQNGSYQQPSGDFGIEDMADAMAKQLMSSVRWVEIIQKLIADGVDTFIEFGPGKTLSGLVKKIDKNVKSFSVGDCESLEAVIEELHKISDSSEE